MTTVYHKSNALAIPDELARAVGLSEGARIEMTATPDGVLMKRQVLSYEEKAAILQSLQDEGRRLLAGAGSQLEALLRDRAEDDVLDLEDETA